MGGSVLFNQAERDAFGADAVVSDLRAAVDLILESATQISGKARNYQLVPVPDGDICNAALFIKQAVSIPGLTPINPNGRWYPVWVRVRRTDREFEEFKFRFAQARDEVLLAVNAEPAFDEEQEAKYDQWVESNSNKSKARMKAPNAHLKWEKENEPEVFLHREECKKRNKQITKAIWALSDAITEAAQLKAGRVATYFASLWKSKDPRMVSLNPDRGTQAYKLVPHPSWFPEQVRNLTAQDILPCFAEPELKLFQLSLGRVLMGASGEEAIEGLVEHGFRHAVILQSEAGLGKSYLLSQITNLLGRLGYSHRVLDPNFGKFGFGDIAASDLAWIDDLNVSNLSKFFNHPLSKSLISNGLVRVEEKGIPSVEVKSRTVLFGCTNHVSPSDLFDIDEGAADRFNVLLLERRAGLKLGQHQGQPSLYTHFTTLCEELGTTVEALLSWLLRLSLDYTLEVLGYEFTDWGLNRVKPDSYREVYRSLRDQLKVRTNQDHLADLAKTVEHCIEAAYATANRAERRRIQEALKLLPFNHVLLAECLNVWVHARFVPAELRPLLTPITLSRICVPSVQKQIEQFSTGQGRNKNVDEAFKQLTSLLKSTEGVGYHQVQWKYNRFFQPKAILERLMDDGYVEQIEERYCEAIAGQPELTETFNNIVSHLKSLVVL